MRIIDDATEAKEIMEKIQANKMPKDPNLTLSEEVWPELDIDVAEFWVGYLAEMAKGPPTPTAPRPVLEAPKGKSREFHLVLSPVDLAYLAAWRSENPWLRSDAQTLRYALSMINKKSVKALK